MFPSEEISILLDRRATGSFYLNKDIAGNSPMLTMPDFQKPFIIYVDASELGVGAVLMQDNDH